MDESEFTEGAGWGVTNFILKKEMTQYVGRQLKLKAALVISDIIMQ